MSDRLPISAERFMWARVTAEGTACSETALCMTHRYQWPAYQGDETGPESERPVGVHVNCSGNEALACQVCGARTPTDEHRRELGLLMGKVAESLGEMFSYWVVNDLPWDFLKEEEYPFHRALEDLQAEVAHAAELIRGEEEA